MQLIKTKSEQRYDYFESIFRSDHIFVSKMH